MKNLTLKTKLIYLKFLYFDYWLFRFFITFKVWKLLLKNEIEKEIFWQLLDFNYKKNTLLTTKLSILNK